jgi:hypothetical protein
VRRSDLNKGVVVEFNVICRRVERDLVSRSFVFVAHQSTAAPSIWHRCVLSSSDHETVFHSCRGERIHPRGKRDMLPSRRQRGPERSATDSSDDDGEAGNIAALRAVDTSDDDGEGNVVAAASSRVKPRQRRSAQTGNDDDDDDSDDRANDGETDSDSGADDEGGAGAATTSSSSTGQRASDLEAARAQERAVAAAATAIASASSSSARQAGVTWTPAQCAAAARVVAVLRRPEETPSAALRRLQQSAPTTAPVVPSSSTTNGGGGDAAARAALIDAVTELEAATALTAAYASGAVRGAGGAAAGGVLQTTRDELVLGCCAATAPKRALPPRFLIAWTSVAPAPLRWCVSGASPAAASTTTTPPAAPALFGPSTVAEMNAWVARGLFEQRRAFVCDINQPPPPPGRDLATGRAWVAVPAVRTDRLFDEHDGSITAAGP